MNAGNWHRLDNVFAIASFCAIMYHIADFKTPKQKELARWGILMFNLFCQERGPWEIINLIIPLLLALSIVLLKFSITKEHPVFNHNIRYGTAFGIMALIFFFRYAKVVWPSDECIEDWMKMLIICVSIMDCGTSSLVSQCTLYITPKKRKSFLNSALLLHIMDCIFSCTTTKLNLVSISKFVVFIWFNFGTIQLCSICALKIY